MKSPIVLYEPPKRARTDYESAYRRGRTGPHFRFFDVVEVNSSFYAIPSVEMTTSWVERTPAGFLFNMKAFGLLTGHHLDAARLPDALRKMLPAGSRKQQRGRIANTALGDEARAWAFNELHKTLAPLRKADKLGYVLFQLAPWLKFSDESLGYLETLPRRLPYSVIAVEFRNRSWFGEHTDDTLKFCKDHGLSYVSIDGPRSRATVPSLPALTSPTAVFRLHGRNFQGHLKQLQGKQPSVSEKYDYLYSEKELEEIARAAGALNGCADRVHMAMNNNNRDYPVRSGLQLKEMLLEDWHPPDREALITELEERRAPGKSRSRRQPAA